MPAAGIRTHHQVTFAALAAGVAAYALLQSLVTPVLTTVQAQLHTTQSAATWVLTAYLLSASVFTPIMGRIGDMAGKKRVFVVALVALAAGSLLAALASNIGLMIFARAVQGIGGGVLPLAFGIIRDEFPREKVAGAVGLLASLTAVGAGLGIVLAGPIVNALDYHWLFWIPGIVIAGSAAATHYLVPESPVRAGGKVSWVAAILLSGWLVALLLAVSEAPSWGWLSTSVIGLIVAAFVIAGAWVMVELRSRNPLIDMRMMRARAVWTTNLVGFMFGAGMYAVFAFVPEFVQTPTSAGYGFGASITESGLISLPMAIVMFIFGSLSGPLSARIGARMVLFAGSVVSAVGFLMWALTHSEIWQVSVAMSLLGAGIGLGFSAMTSIIVDAVPSSQTGVASGMNANIRTIGGAVGAAVVASVVTANVRSDGFPQESGYTNGYLVLAAASVVGAAACLLIRNLRVDRDELQAEQAGLAHAEAGMVAAATLVGDLPE